MELHCICRCLVPLEVNGATLHLLEVPWIFGSKIGSKMELRSILLRMPCVPLEANGATLHLLGVPWTFGSKWSYAPFVGDAFKHRSSHHSIQHYVNT